MNENIKHSGISWQKNPLIHKFPSVGWLSVAPSRPELRRIMVLQSLSGKKMPSSSLWVTLCRLLEIIFYQECNKYGRIIEFGKVLALCSSVLGSEAQTNSVLSFYIIVTVQLDRSSLNLKLSPLKVQCGNTRKNWGEVGSLEKTQKIKCKKVKRNDLLRLL